MKAFIIAGLLALTGCASDGSTSVNSVSSATDSLYVHALQGLTLAETAYKPLNADVQTAVIAGQIKGATATRVREINRTVTLALSIAHASTDAATIAVQVAAINASIAELSTLVPMKVN